jgi:hypothetical protein
LFNGRWRGKSKLLLRRKAVALADQCPEVKTTDSISLAKRVRSGEGGCDGEKDGSNGSERPHCDKKMSEDEERKVRV